MPVDEYFRLKQFRGSRIWRDDQPEKAFFHRQSRVRNQLFSMSDLERPGDEADGRAGAHVLGRHRRYENESEHAYREYQERAIKKAQNMTATPKSKSIAEHGTRNRYSYHGCRCNRCRRAAADYQRSWRDAQRAMNGAYTI